MRGLTNIYGAERVVDSFDQTQRREPGAYLRDTLAKIGGEHPVSRIAELTPWVMRARRGHELTGLATRAMT